jgi:hypothetical protein
MRKLSRSIQIDASPERVYDFLNVPENFLIVWPSMVEVAHVKPNSLGANDFDWVYKMAGVRFHGHCQIVDAQRGRLQLAKNEGGIPSSFRWTFETRGGGTFLNVDIEYTIPTPIIGKIAESVVVKMNEHEIELLLANIKQNVEAIVKGAATQPRANATPPR